MSTCMKSGFLVVMMLCAAMAAHTAGGAEDKARPLEAGEMVFVDVYRHAELSTTVQVDTAGNIMLPQNLGNVHLAGLTENEASAAVSKAYFRILKNPRVTVSRSGTATGGYGGYRTENMQTEIIPLNNANAETLSASLQGVTSEGGAIGFDSDTNSIIITDTPAALQNVIGVVKRLDTMRTQLTQVRIEAKLAEVQVGAMKELGVRWFAQGDHALGGYYPMPNQDINLNAMKGSAANPINNESVGSNYGSGSGSSGAGRRFIDEGNLDRRLQVPVQVAKVGQMLVGYNNSGIDLGALLDALVADNRAEMLANPYLVTVNHKPADIGMVEEFPYTEYGTEGLRSSYSTRFMDLGIKLTVTPHVLQDDTEEAYVKLELAPEVSFATGSNNGVPVRAVRNYNGEANVRDGQTFVIGGIYKNDVHDVDQRVPGLGKIPMVGKLFKHTEKVKTKTELMVFVTPTIHETPESVTWDKMIDLKSAGVEEQKEPPLESKQGTLRE